MAKMRLDALMLQRGLCESRTIAQSLIIQGRVRVNGAVVIKAGTATAEDATVDVENNVRKYVSRGGLKLEHALDRFGIHVDGMMAIDAGSSTGGFTDCLLKRGARKVYAVDVGRGQMDWTLRMDGRILCLEGKNARHLTKEDIPESADIITADLSFISLALVFPALRNLLSEEGCIVALIKPQFEAGRSKVRKGVVKDPSVHVEVLRRVLESACRLSLGCGDVTYSPLKGPSGNIEFFGLFRHGKGEAAGTMDTRIDDIVKEAHALLLKGKDKAAAQ
jgi:23S rRNA (cytidine1920-2'-O)/16S rRNA (cytidine1409-2'-O)-methyltransferase